MAYVIVIQAPGSAPVAYGPEKQFARATAIKDRLVAQEDGLTGLVTHLNPVPSDIEAEVA